MAGPPVSKEEMSNLRRQWPTSLMSGMTRRKTDLELLSRECKSRFRGSQTGRCTYCGRRIVHDMARHVSIYHLDLGHLWRCPVSWCTRWKGAPHDYIDHIRMTHHVGVSDKTANLGKWFPPWTVMRAAERDVEAECVGHIHQRGAVQRAWGPVGPSLPGGNFVAHASLRGSFMIYLLYFTSRACADARWVAKRSRNSATGSASSPDELAPLPISTTHRTPDDNPLVWKAPRAVSSATRDQSSPVGTSAVVSVERYSVPPVPMVCPAGGDRSCLCRCRECALPLRMSHRISDSRPRSRPSCIHRLPGPGSRPSALIWPTLTCYNWLPGVCGSCGPGGCEVTGAR